jgi:hypothetical protein
MYEIHAPLPSVLGGPVRLHSVGDGWCWQYGVSWHAVWVSREAAQAVAAGLPDCRDWRGHLVGRPVVLQSASAEEWRAHTDEAYARPVDFVAPMPARASKA